MTTLEERMAGSELLRQAVLDTRISNRRVGDTWGIDESVIRRYRHRNIVDPHPGTASKMPAQGLTAQWTPGLDLSRDRGEARTLPVPVADGPTPDDLTLLNSVGADPEKWSVKARKESRWQNAGGDWLSAHKLELERRGVETGDLSVAQIGEILEDYSGRDGLANSDNEETQANTEKENRGETRPANRGRRDRHPRLYFHG